MERADLEQWKAREVARLLALVETERRYYQEIVAAIPVGLLVLSNDLAIVSSNRAVRSIFGLRGRDSVRGRLDALLPAWVLDRVEDVLKTGVAQTGILVETEREPKRRLRIGILAIRNWDDETAQEALLSIEDLSGITAGEAHTSEVPVPQVVAPSLPVSELIESLEAILWVVELRSMRFMFVSPHAEKVLGFPVDHWTGDASFWLERVAQEDRDWVAQSYNRAIERGEGHACEFRAVTRNGDARWLRESARIIADMGGRSSYLIGIAVDITERRELENQLLQSERIDSVSKLASRMAHELNNSLMILTGYGEELMNAIPAGNALRADVQQIMGATERMSGLTGHLLAFSRRPPAATSPMDLKSALATLEGQLGALMGESVPFEFQLPAESMWVKADPAQLQQVVTAILQRARRRMQQSGKIRLVASRLEIAEDLRRAGTPLHAGSYAVVTIGYSDRAGEGEAPSGLLETVLPGKDAADEAAAAVARAYGIVRQWDGDISVSTTPREGTVYRLFLELVQAPVRSEAKSVVTPEAPTEPQRRRETILVVEDEAGIRALVRKILRRQGHEVLEAANGDEALAVCAEHTGTIDLLITDVMMPQMGGRELVDRLREQWHDLRVLYVSGYTDDASIYAGNFPPGTAFLQKPFTLGSLLDKVKEVLSVKVG